MRRKLVSKACALIVIALLAASAHGAGTKAYASELVTYGSAMEQAVLLYEKLSGTEVSVPDELVNSGTDPVFLKAVRLGYANMSDEGETAYPIKKQDMMSVLYKAVIGEDSSFAISQEEADVILNNCYDNALIEDENRIAYAFMMKQGIISEKAGTDPDKELTIDSCRELINLVDDLFAKGDTVKVGGCRITKGENIRTVLSVLGDPNRIDPSEYGFDWYVYNGSYDKFVMIGVYADRICAVYTNNCDFEVNGIKSGDDIVKTILYIGDEAYKFYSDPQGRVDAVLYKPVKTFTGFNEAVLSAKSSEFIDMINAYRSKNAKTIYIQDPSMDSAVSEAETAVSEGRLLNGMFTADGMTIFEAYSSVVNAEDMLVSNGNRYPSMVSAKTTGDSNGVFTVAMVDFDRAVAAPEAGTVEPELVAVQELEQVAEVTTPVIETPTTETIYDNGDDVVIKLAMQAATQYHIEVFDLEDDSYVINEYLNTDSTEIVLPSELFRNGGDYRIVVSSVTPEGISLSGDPIMISYGSTYDTGIRLLSPYDGGVTDDDYIALKWESELYHDFRVDLYDQEGQLITSETFEDKYEAVIRGIDPGEYYIYVTALRRGTEIEKAQASADVRVNLPEPVIDEIILERNDKYYFAYEDKTLGVLYFYDEELVDVEKTDGTVETKKKIIRKQVKDTKGYRELAKQIRKREYTTGSPYLTALADSEIGNNIVSEAEKYLDVPYVWGGETPSGFDCSGLVQYVMNSLGISVPRVSQEQFLVGTPISKGELQPGDLVFFESGGDVHHVGIYVGNGMMIHAPRTGDVVRYQSMETPYYLSEYVGARRMY